MVGCRSGRLDFDLNIHHLGKIVYPFKGKPRKETKAQAQINCLGCGVLIDAGQEQNSAQMCLICYARALNQNFQKRHSTRNQGGRDASRAA